MFDFNGYVANALVSLHGSLGFTAACSASLQLASSISFAPPMNLPERPSAVNYHGAKQFREQERQRVAALQEEVARVNPKNRVLATYAKQFLEHGRDARRRDYV